MLASQHMARGPGSWDIPLSSDVSLASSGKTNKKQKNHDFCWRFVKICKGKKKLKKPVTDNRRARHTITML